MSFDLQFDITTPTNFSTKSPEKRKAGRPRLNNPKRRRTNPRERPTRLNVRRPVTTEIPGDIWDCVFSWCTPNDLQNLRRVCKAFRDFITKNHTSVWTHARLCTYGEYCPAPPDGLDERQYTDLVKGQGCMSCKRRPNARKTYWVWQRRWCTDCFHKKTIPIESLEKFQNKYPGLIHCVRRAKADSWNRYEKVWHDDVGESRPLARTCFLKGDIEAIIAEFERFVDSIKSHTKQEQVQMLKKWREAKEIQAEEYMDRIHEIETFFNTSRRSSEDSANWKEVRVQFYRKNALEMIPPMNEDVLDIIPAYQRAIIIPREPTEKSWDELRPKLEEVRSAAEAQIEELMIAKNSDRRMDYPKIQLDRRSRPSEGQVRILELADQVLEESEQELEKIAYKDVAQLFLRMVWTRYDDTPPQNRPKAENEDLSGPHESYRLCLADLRDVYEKLCLWMEQRWSIVHRVEGQRFKCPACTSTQYNKKWKLHELFHHLRAKHSKMLNSPWKEYHKISLHFGLNVEFPWAAIEWPRTLPVLAPDQKATGTWDPTGTAPVLQRLRSGSFSPEPAVSAFNKRLVKTSSIGQMTKVGLVGSILEADSLLKDTNLPDNFKTLIAWRYAVERYEALGPKSHREDEQALTELDLGLLRMGGQCTVLNKLFCKSCTHNSRLRSHVGYGMTGHDFHKMANHYQRQHGGLYGRARSQWKTEMLDLPSGEMLLAALAQWGAEDARAAFEKLFPLTP